MYNGQLLTIVDLGGVGGSALASSRAMCRIRIYEGLTNGAKAPVAFARTMLAASTCFWRATLLTAVRGHHWPRLILRNCATHLHMLSTIL